MSDDTLRRARELRDELFRDDAIVMGILEYYRADLNHEVVYKGEIEKITQIVLFLLKMEGNKLGDVDIDFHGRRDELDEFSSIFVNAAVAGALTSEVSGDGYVFRRYFPRYASRILNTISLDDQKAVHNAAEKSHDLMNRFDTVSEAINFLKKEVNAEDSAS